MTTLLPQFPGGGRYRKLGPTLKERFGQRIHKITLRGGFGCPNRDGRVGSDGCVFCSEVALLPKSGPSFGSLEDQLDAGFAISKKLHATTQAIAYFQDQTATDAPIQVLSDLYSRALSHPQVVALSVGTRPDWIDDHVLELLAQLSKKKPVFLELGLQSANDDILKTINRGHKVADFENAVIRTREAGLEVIAHIILGLPGEQDHDRINTALCLNRLKVEGVKMHNLHVLANTRLARLYLKGEVHITSLTEYANMALSFLQVLDPDVVVHRLTGHGPAHLMLAPSWAAQKRKAIQEIEKVLYVQDVWQGKLFDGTRR